MKIFSTLIFGLIIFQPLFAQDDNDNVIQDILEPKITFEIDFRAVAALGEFGNNYPDGGMGGFGASILVPVSKNFPLDFGIDAGLYFMSGTESVTPFEKGVEEGQELKTTVVGTMLPIHLVCRAYPLKHKQTNIQPYAEVLFGGKVFATEQTTELYFDDEKSKKSSEKKDDDSKSVSNSTGSLSYGFGVGTKARISKNNLLYINFKINQLFGDEVKYIDATKAKLNIDGEYESVYHFSKTDILQIAIGLHLMIE